MSIIREIREQPRLKPKARWRIGLALAVAIQVALLSTNYSRLTSSCCDQARIQYQLAAACYCLGGWNHKEKQSLPKLHSSTEWSKS